MARAPRPRARNDHWSAVGTANLDNRSCRLNFEVTVLVEDQAFSQQMAEVLERDFANCRLIDADELRRRSLVFKVGVRVARLMSPLL